jgi:hypothetical protein
VSVLALPFERQARLRLALASDANTLVGCVIDIRAGAKV